MGTRACSYQEFYRRIHFLAASALRGSLPWLVSGLLSPSAQPGTVGHILLTLSLSDPLFCSFFLSWGTMWLNWFPPDNPGSFLCLSILNWCTARESPLPCKAAIHRFWGLVHEYLSWASLSGGSVVQSSPACAGDGAPIPWVR